MTETSPNALFYATRMGVKATKCGPGRFPTGLHSNARVLSAMEKLGT